MAHGTQKKVNKYKHMHAYHVMSINTENLALASGCPLIEFFFGLQSGVSALNLFLVVPKRCVRWFFTSGHSSEVDLQNRL